MKPEDLLVVDDCFETDGKTVWVSSHDGHCIGRFSRFGVDVHQTAEQQMSGSSECLFCTHPPTPPSWPDFVAAMHQHHGVVVPETLRPAWVVQEVKL